MENAIAAGKTVGQIVAENPAAASVFEKHGIDFCCGGGQPLKDACRARNASVETVTRELETAAAGQPSEAGTWPTAPLGALVEHIVSTHHRFLAGELPQLQARMAKVVEAHGPRFPHLAQLAGIFGALSAELGSHLMKEEMILFPYIQRLEEAHASGRPAPVPPFGSVRNPIRMMEHEHDSAGEALAEMRRLTNGYAVPDDVCNTYRALYFGLERLERDLHIHIHLENSILFPRAAALEEGL